MMEDTESDFTMTFRELSEVSAKQLLNKNFTQVELKVTKCCCSFQSLDFVVKLADLLNQLYQY